MALTLRNVLLIASVLVPTLAVPVFEPATALTCTLHDQDQISTYRADAGSSPLRRLRDAIIEKIWDVPKKQEYRNKHSERKKSAPSNFRKRYGDDVVLRFTIDSDDDAKAFSEAALILYLDVWDSTQNWVDVRIAKQMLPSLLNLLPQSLQKAYRPLMPDLAQAVYDTYSSAQQDPWRAKEVTTSNGRHDLFFADYQRLSAIYPWLQMLASIFRNTAELITIGNTAEGRPIQALRIGARSTPDSEENVPRRTLLVTAGSHAREWISVSTANYIIYTLLTRFQKDPIVTKFLTHYDIIVIPVLNPDGYDYTWTTDRLWRKNRQSTTLPFCPGIDLDRSFSFNWDGALETSNPCAENYAGTHPFHAVEAKTLADWTSNYTLSHSANFVSYIDLHSYSQQILYPYSYSCLDRPSNMEDLQEIALGIAKSCRVTTGVLYSVSSACQGAVQQYSSSGGSALDFFYHDRNVELAYQVKLRDQGTYGFLLPKSNIVPTGKEAFEALIGLGRWLLGNRGIEGLSGIDPDQEQEQEPNSEPTSDQNDINFDIESNLSSDINVNDPNDLEDELDRIFDPDFELELKRRRR